MVLKLYHEVREKEKIILVSWFILVLEHEKLVHDLDKVRGVLLEDLYVEKSSL